MVDISKAMEAKSDQLNAVDILGADIVIRVRAVNYTGEPQQPVWVYFDGDNNRPWKPSKGMIRLLAAGWGKETDNWIGRQVQIYCDSSVVYAGQEVGGIRIKAMSDIDQRGITVPLTLSKQKRIPWTVQYLKVQEVAYPAGKFEAALPSMQQAMQSGKMTMQQIVAQCQKTGQLTQEQLARLEQVAPVETNEDEA